MSQSQSTVVARRQWWNSAEADPDFPCHAECEIIHVEEAVHDLLLYAKTWPRESEKRFAVGREGDVRHVGTPNEAFLKLYQSLCWLGLVSSSQLSDVMQKEAANAAVVRQEGVLSGIPDESSPNGKERLDMIVLSVLRDVPHQKMWPADDLAMTLSIPRAASQASLCRLRDAGMLAESTDGKFYLLEEYDWETFDRCDTGASDDGSQAQPDEPAEAAAG